MLLFNGLGFAALFGVLMYMGRLNPFFLFGSSILLFSIGAGVGLVIDGLRGLISEHEIKPGGSPSPA